MAKHESIGQQGTDTVTGFKGTVTAHCSYISGSERIGLTPTHEQNGKYVDEKWFDLERVELAEEVVDDTTQAE